MMQLSTKVTLIFVLTFTHSKATKPPGYVEPPKVIDPNPPKYEYGYNISNNKGEEQGKKEQRDGIYASGRYYVQEKDSNQDVQYFADDWGYHPVVEYSSAGPHSRTRTKFALGEEAVQQLRNKENNRPQLQGIPQIGNLNQGEILSQYPQQARETSTLLDQNDRRERPRLLQSQNQQLSRPDEVENQEIGQNFPSETLVQQSHQQQTNGQVDQPTQINADNRQFQQELSTSQQVFLVQQQDLSAPQQYHFVTRQGLSPQQLQLVSQPELLTTQQILLTPQEGIYATQPPERQVVIHHVTQRPETESRQGPPRDYTVFSEVTTEFSDGVSKQNVQNSFVQSSQTNEIRTPTNVPDERQTYETYENRQSTESQQAAHERINLQPFSTFGLKINGRSKPRPNKLIENTKNLVSGEDVLNINEAVSLFRDTVSTPYNLNDYITSQLLSDQNLSSSPSTTPSTVTEHNFEQQPIVVAEGEENRILSSTTKTQLEDTISTTGNRIDISSTYRSPTTFVVTPRPVSTNFLAPITAGIRLQNLEQIDEKHKSDERNSQIEIQKSVPFYLGKYEYPSSLSVDDSSNNGSYNFHSNAVENIELGNTLLFFPGQGISTAEKLVQQPPKVEVKEQFGINSNIKHLQELDQQQAQGYQHQIFVQQTGIGESNQEKFNQREITKVIHKPYPVRVPYEVPYPVIKQVQVPITVQRIVEKPIHITKYIDRPVPYPVEKVVEKPVHIPVQVTKYVDRPYPVEVKVPYPQPYPVEKLVEKIVRQPYPVAVRVPVHVEKIVEKKVHVPHYIEKQVPVEKIVEKPVQHFIDRPYPVEVRVPVAVEKIVEKSVPHYIDRPYPVETKVVQPYYVDTFRQIPSQVQPLKLYHQTSYSNEQYTQQSQPQALFYANPYVYAAQVNQYIPPSKGLKGNNNGYLPPKLYTSNNRPQTDLDCNQQDQSATNTKQIHNSFRPDDNIGLLPPRQSNNFYKLIRKFRTARSNFNYEGIRIEYGFLPPLKPSLEIDQSGNPIEKNKK